MPSTKSSRQCWIRHAVAADKPAIARLLEDLQSLHAKLQPRLFAEAEASQIPLTLPKPSDPAAMFVAVADGDVIGMISARVYDTPKTPTMVQTRRGYLEELVVSGSHRRGGVAKALLKAAEDWLAQCGASDVMLTLWADNQPARELYRELGYGEVGFLLAKTLD
jgi:ribosomal protein S18 acetylase RimI-like enzyme